MARLPRKGLEKRIPSSSENPTIYDGEGKFYLLSVKVFDEGETHDDTERGPSKAPAFGTVSRCDPMTRRGKSGTRNRDRHPVCSR